MIHAALALALLAAPPAVALKVGEPAPFTGQLLRPDLAAKLVAQEEFRERELNLAVTATAAVWRARDEFHLQERDYWKTEAQEARDSAETGWAAAYIGGGTTVVLGIVCAVLALAR